MPTRTQDLIVTRTHAPARTAARVVVRLCAALALCASAATAAAATIVTYDFSQGSTVDSRKAATSVAAGIVASAFDITAGPGTLNTGFLTQANGVDTTTGSPYFGTDTSGGLFQVLGWASTTRIGFTLTIPQSYRLNLSGLTFCNISAGAGTGGSQQFGLCGGTAGNTSKPFGTYDLVLSSSLGSVNLISGAVPGAGSPTVVNTDLSTLPLAQNLTGTLTFSFKGNTPFDATRSWRVDNLVLSGALEAIPATRVPVPWPALTAFAIALAVSGALSARPRAV